MRCLTPSKVVHGFDTDTRVRPLTAREIAPKELYLDNGTRTTQQASEGGTFRGLEPADIWTAVANHRRLTIQSCHLG